MPTLEQYQQMLEQVNAKCKWCEDHVTPIKTELATRSIEYYEHDGGWNVDGFDQKQWLYVTCPICKYEWSLWKLGIDRPNGIEKVPTCNKCNTEIVLISMPAQVDHWVHNNRFIDTEHSPV